MLVNYFRGACRVFFPCVLLLAVGSRAQVGTCECPISFISDEKKGDLSAEELVVWTAEARAVCSVPKVDICVAPTECVCRLIGFNTDTIGPNGETVIICDDGSAGVAQCKDYNEYCETDLDCVNVAGQICCSKTKICETPPDDPQVCGDPHMTGLRGQKIDWSGIDGGWYCLVRDDAINLQVNLRLTAPLADEFPDRQLITGLSVLSEGHSLVVEVDDPYSVYTDGCVDGTSPCLSNGGLTIVADGNESGRLLHPTRDEHVAGGMRVSASNLPVECRLFGGSTVWAQMYDEMLLGHRQLGDDESYEAWVMTFDHVAAPQWCVKYIEEHGLFDVQSTYSLFRVSTPTADVQLHVGVDHQGGGQLDWDGRVLPDLDFWQMDAGVHGLSLDSETLTGILGETARPVLDEHGHEIMQGYDAMRGTVEDYRVSGALGTEFALLHSNQAA